jgi:hypothetical protein
MKERVREVLLAVGLLVGGWIAKALGRAGHETAGVVVFGATAVWVLGWLIWDKVLFKKEIAERTQRLAERRAAVRAAKYAAAQERARNKPRS